MINNRIKFIFQPKIIEVLIIHQRLLPFFKIFTLKLSVQVPNTFDIIMYVKR